MKTSNDIQFTIEDYSQKPPFTSFLPGIAGQLGIPMWVFYTNRGQAITSFGIKNKDNPILEFQPANKAYQNTAFNGFRTFIKYLKDEEKGFYEPFAAIPYPNTKRKMIIDMNQLTINEVNVDLGISINITYFTIPLENFAGLARKVEIKNISPSNIQYEILDGLPQIIPFGVNNAMLKEISRTVESWMEVYNHQNNVPFYRVRASIEDKAEIKTYQAGHFILSFNENEDLLPAFIDSNIIFGQNTAFSQPDNFLKNNLNDLKHMPQIDGGKTPCGFFGQTIELLSTQTSTHFSIFGHINSLEQLNREYKNWKSKLFFEMKQKEARSIVNDLTNVVSTKTSNPTFDTYCRQTYLDNLIRGGVPIILGNNKKSNIFHIYSRKHGDPERDYNNFIISPEYYSQGNGAYRDVNQNRRLDVFFNRHVGATNIYSFFSLLQLDGYNPLIVQGSSYTLTKKDQQKIMKKFNLPSKISEKLEQTFTPGNLIKIIKENQIVVEVSYTTFLNEVFSLANQEIIAKYGEGYWIDHWTYNLDLVENYISIYPDKFRELLLETKEFQFFDDSYLVAPRSKKYTLTKQGPKQINAIYQNDEKELLISSRAKNKQWVRTENGKGEIYSTNLLSKMICLAVVKFSTMDPSGMGIEMEAGKPGWYDALNGLPGIFGSGMSESYELLRLIIFMIDSIKQLNNERKFEILIPAEVSDLIYATDQALLKYNSSVDVNKNYKYWDTISTARETMREQTIFGINGSEISYESEVMLQLMNLWKQKIEDGIDLAERLNKGLPPTYIMHQIIEYEPLKDAQNIIQRDHQENPYIKVTKFEPKPLPLFLEGFVRAFKIASKDKAKQYYRQVRESDLYDKKLFMYKVNTSLESMPHDIGRTRAFTPGWLENESIWLHMEYKYLLEILKSGLYEEFYNDMKTALIPFLDYQTYKRSPFENSSFIVSSVHPDQSLHGAGFIARLSGSTAEFLNIWQLMMIGKNPFRYENKKLSLHFEPVLQDWLFDENDQVKFKFLGQCEIVYHNPSRRNTYEQGFKPYKCIAEYKNGGIFKVESDHLPPLQAEYLRNGLIDRVHVYYPQE